LKRFQYNITDQQRSKVHDIFEFPFEYDFGHLYENQIKTHYILQGIVVHTGEAQLGHFFSFIRQKEIWLKCNDMIISQVSMNEVKSISYGQSKASTVLLFFKRNDFDEEIHRNISLNYFLNLEFLNFVCNHFPFELILKYFFRFYLHGLSTVLLHRI
jgi:hypothetical protein